MILSRHFGGPCVARAVLLLLAAGSVAAAGEIPTISGASHAVVKAGERSRGMFGVCVLHHSEIPLLCFGLNKRPGQKTRFTYLVLLKVGPRDNPHEQGISSSGPGRFSPDAVKGAATASIGDRTFDVRYDIEVHPKTHKTRKEQIVIHGLKLKPKGPRVFLLDLTADRPVPQAVEVPLPAECPDLTDEEMKTWVATLRRAVDELREKSEAVRAFED